MNDPDPERCFAESVCRFSIAFVRIVPGHAKHDRFGLAAAAESSKSVVCPRSVVLKKTGPSRPDVSEAATVLVVEDDRAIRHLFTAVLRGNGYSVIACEDGAKGLEAARAHITEISAVITDSRMPGLSGRELIVAIRALRPEMPILVVSGNLDDRNAGHGDADRTTLFLTKPLSPDQLVIELRRILDGASPDPVR